MQCIFSPRAEEDLEEIGDYIARDNPVRALSFISELKEQCYKITAMPLAAPLRPELGEGVRMIVHGQYLIFYVIGENEVRIQRIVHGARNMHFLFDA